MAFKILLIAGHGAGDSGAVGNGFQEQERTRAIVSELKNRIEGAQVDVFDMSKNCVTECRAGRVPNFAAYNYVLEIHLNASANPAAHGTMCYIDQSERGHSVEDKILEELYAVGYSKCWDGVVVTQRQFSSGLVVQNRCRQQGVSHCLLETCFISNKADLDRLNSKLAQTAQAIANGVMRGFGLNVYANDSNASTGLVGAEKGTSVNYMVQVGISNLNIRKSPSAKDNSNLWGKYTGVGAFTIVEEASGPVNSAGTIGKWGLLKSYAAERNGWICLSYTKRV